MTMPWAHPHGLWILATATACCYAGSLWTSCRALMTCIALSVQAAALYGLIDTPMGQNLNAWNMLAFCLWMGSCVMSLWPIWRPTGALPGLVHAASSVSLVLAVHYQGSGTPHAFLNTPWMWLHVGCSSLGVALIMLSALQAFLLARQEHALRAPALRTSLALETQEHILTTLLVLGFSLLSIGFLGGMVGTHPSHLKIASALSAWVCCGILIHGRLHHGWRGSTLIGGTWLLTSTLLLGYFGSTMLQLGAGA